MSSVGRGLGGSVQRYGSRLLRSLVLWKSRDWQAGQPVLWVMLCQQRAGRQGCAHPVTLRHPPSPQSSPIQKKAGKVVGTQETVSHLSGCRTSEVGEMACLLRCSDEH